MMMKPKHYLLMAIFTVLLTEVNLAQSDPCGTKPSKDERALYLSQVADLRNQPLQRSYEDNTFKVIMYRLRHSNGSGALSDQQFAEEINLLNSFYNPYDVCFSLTKIVNIDNSNWVNMNWGGAYDSCVQVVRNDFPHFDDAVTIYVLPPEILINVKGKALGIPSSAFFMVSEPGWWNTGLAAHEMGHCFGLFHTHETAGNSSIELVTRTLGASCINGQGAWQDCNVGGDALCDTPADFNFDNNAAFVDPNTCAYIGDSTDCQGNTYTPDPTNIMSYSFASCIDFLSGQQVGKMHLTIDASLIFNNTQAPIDHNFGDAVYSSGYDHFLAKNTINIVPGNEYRVEGSAQIVHDAEGFIDMKPGFIAAPTSVDGYFRARAKDLCDNDTTVYYALPN